MMWNSEVISDEDPGWICSGW